MEAPHAMQGSRDVIRETSTFTTEQLIMSHPHFSDGSREVTTTKDILYETTTADSTFEEIAHEMSVEIGFSSWVLVFISIVVLVVLGICFFYIRSFYLKRYTRRNKKDICMKSSTYKKIPPDMCELTNDLEESDEGQSKYNV